MATMRGVKPVLGSRGLFTVAPFARSLRHTLAWPFFAANNNGLHYQQTIHVFMHHALPWLLPYYVTFKCVTP